MNGYDHPITKAFSSLVFGICKYPEHCTITELLDPTGMSLRKLTVEAHMADMPVLVGRAGRQVKAFKYLVAQAASNGGIEAEFSLVDSHIGTGEPPTPFVYNRFFDRQTFLDLLDQMLDAVFSKKPEVRIMERDNPRDGLKILLDAAKEEEHLIVPLADVWYPYGIRKGMKLDLKRFNESELLGARSFSGRE